MKAFIECLTLRTWGGSILPTLLRRQWRGEPAIERCVVFDASRPGMAMARAWQWMTGTVIEPFQFRLLDVRDEHGYSIWLRLLYQDMAQVQAQAVAESGIDEAMQSDDSTRPRLPVYLAKVLAESTANLAERQTLWRALLVLHICHWNKHTAGEAQEPGLVFLERRPWLGAIVRDAARFGLTVVPTAQTLRVIRWLRRHLPMRLVAWLRDLRASRTGTPAPSQRLRPERSSRARLAVEYYGHFNLAHPERYSDLFFWQQSSLPGQDLVVTFGLPQDPLNEQKLAALAERGMSAVALHRRATALSDAPVCFHRTRQSQLRIERPNLKVIRKTLEARWVDEQVQAYTQRRAYWDELFASLGVKVYVTWVRCPETHCAIADALQHLGGVMAVYQRSYEALPSPDSTVAADLVFAMSPRAAEVERQSGSRIPYLVTTGYLGDHRFPLLREQAQTIRQRLHQRGAQRIIAFCDEYSTDDDRWLFGHHLLREAYAFWFEKVLREPWLGLVVKPKTPYSLSKRLGPVAPLLAQAVATGRCVLFEDGIVHGSYPPAAAALASDVMVHSHLWAATAGVESALAGVPTLFMDREGCPESPFYRLGDNRVVFRDWETLWKACGEHWSRPGGVPGFGDWSLMLDELDPFRDGRAAERMGTYLHWLLEGFHAGRGRDTVMADAAERYAARWGKDKVTSVPGGLAQAAAIRQPRSQPAEAVSVP